MKSGNPVLSRSNHHPASENSSRITDHVTDAVYITNFTDDKLNIFIKLCVAWAEKLQAASNFILALQTAFISRWEREGKGEQKYGE